MATTPEFIENLLEQLSDVGELRARKAFGEYLVYVDDKFVLTVCDNTVYVKKTRLSRRPHADRRNRLTLCRRKRTLHSRPRRP